MTREIVAPKPVVITAKSFDGNHELTFNEGSHRYKLDGKGCSGWTTIIKGSYPTSVGLTNWMKTEAMKSLFGALTVKGETGYIPVPKLWPISDESLTDLLKFHRDTHEDVAREAADIGTICHAFAELHSLGKKDEAEALLNKVRGVPKWPIIENCVKQYLEWDKQNKGELIMAEEITASPSQLACGKFDRLDRVNGKLRLRDYKTSKSIYPDQFIQMGGYKINIKEWFNLDVEEYEVLRFGKDDGAFETLLITDPVEVQLFVKQAILCRQTFEFKKIENDPRFDWRKK